MRTYFDQKEALHSRVTAKPIPVGNYVVFVQRIILFFISDVVVVSLDMSRFIKLNRGKKIRG